VSREADIEAVLSQADPDAKVTATRDEDGSGSRITVEAVGQVHRFSIGPGRSALLDFLLTGYVT
jgi:hypothetical protein